MGDGRDAGPGDDFFAGLLGGTVVGPGGVTGVLEAVLGGTRDDRLVAEPPLVADEARLVGAAWPVWIAGAPG